MNFFDASIVSFLNGFARRSWTFDAFVGLFDANGLLKGGLVTALLWWMWFRRGDDEASARESIVYVVLTCAPAVIIARAIAVILPFRTRPLHTPALHFQMPYAVDPSVLEQWSGFPSDHAALFFTLAMGLFLVSRRIGLLALSYVSLFICLPRIYMGYHFPTDIIAGALLGIGVAYTSELPTLKRVVTRPAMRGLERAPAMFYACFFLATYEINDLFSSLRGMVRFASYVALGIIKHL